jgi:adenine-specific DNA-methyltransferase
MPTLHWVGKDKVKHHHRDVPYRVLLDDHHYQAPADTPGNSTDNRIIQGDNLEALKSLLPEFEGKVQCIYIDPPYNTGNESWVYNDNVNDPRIKKWLGQVVGKEGEDMSRHDKWLCMMYPRLRLLRRLLADDGVIFVSIDDVEVAHLRLLMDEIFSTSRFIAEFIWKSRQNKDNRTKTGASIDHEYVLCYGKQIRGDIRDVRSYKNDDNDSRGQWTSGNMVGLASKEARPNLHYDLISPETGINYGCPSQGWRYDQARMQSMIRDNRVLWPKNATGRPREKVFLDKLSSEFTGYSSLLPWDLFTYHGTRAIEDIFGSRVFEFPKSADFVARLIEQATNDNKDSIILDSFAGSGTTAHAVLKLNAQDGGNRRFILIEMMDYADSLTAERVRRVMSGYGEGDKAVAGLGGAFTFQRLGEPLFDSQQQLNPAVGLPAVRSYIAWLECIPRQELAPLDNPRHRYWLGEANGQRVFFCYEPERITCLDMDLLNELIQTPGPTLFYADQLALGEELMRRHNLRFKKIPRDITRL